MDILDKLADLHKQATAERSHYYVAATTKEAVAEIILLRSKISVLSEGQKPSNNTASPKLIGELLGILDDCVFVAEKKGTARSK